MLSLLKETSKNEAMLNTAEYHRIMQGPSERDLVYSGLEETMINAVREMVRPAALRPAVVEDRAAKHARSAAGVCRAQITVSEELKCTLRSAAYVCSIRKIYAVYKDAGLILA